MNLKLYLPLLAIVILIAMSSLVAILLEQIGFISFQVAGQYAIWSILVALCLWAGLVMWSIYEEWRDA